MKRAQRRAHLQPKAVTTDVAKPTPTADSYSNFAARLGMGNRNLASAGTYQLNLTSRNRQLLENIYCSSWVAGRSVDVYAEDMTKKGVEINSTADPSEIEALMESWSDLQIWDRLADVTRWARLFGGGIGALLISGADMSTPLRPETIGKDQFSGITVLDRWMVQPSLQDLVTDFGPEFGLPKYYTVTTATHALNGQKIHHSRVIRAEGLQLPFYRKQAEMGWGLSIIERLIERLMAFDSTTVGASQLAFRANIRALKIDGLREILAVGGEPAEALHKSIEFMGLMQSNENISLVDKQDEMQSFSYSFAGLDSLLLQLGMQLSGATGIPLTRFFGMSPAGLNSTGDGDLRTYYDNISSEQNAKLRTPVAKILDISWRSKFGAAPPEGTRFAFKPLWDLSDTDKANIAKTIADAVAELEGQGIIDRATALRELRQSSHVHGYFSNITDEQIADAENEEPPAPEMEFEPEDKPVAEPDADE